MRPHPFVLVGGALEYLNPRLGSGKDGRVPSIEDRFDEATAPGLGESIDYLRSMGFLEIDYREPKNARKGGWYRVDLSRFDDRTTGRFTVNRLDTDLRQFVGVLAGRRVIATRLFVSTSETGPDSVMPFYLMPTLGGNDTLRGFREYRFRGPHALLAQAEYRREIWSGLDGALFYDAGKVADRRADLAAVEESHPGARLKSQIDLEATPERTNIGTSEAFGWHDIGNSGPHLTIELDVV